MKELFTRRSALKSLASGIGYLAFADLAHRSCMAEAPRLHQPHFAARAKRVIFLCMAGGPSHLETFDYKPKLADMDGKPMQDILNESVEARTDLVA